MTAVLTAGAKAAAPSRTSVRVSVGSACLSDSLHDSSAFLSIQIRLGIRNRINEIE